MPGERQLASELVLLSSFVHASWNLAARAVKGDTAVLVLGVCAVAPFFLFLGVIAQAVLSTQPHAPYLKQLEAGWMYLLVTGLSHSLYLLLLAHSYHIGDLSIVYPVARGSSVVFVALVSKFIVPHYTISEIGHAGIVITLVGIGTMTVKGEELRCLWLWQHAQALSQDGSPRIGYSQILDSSGTPNSESKISHQCVETGSESLSKGTEATEMSQRQILVALAFSLSVGACTSIYSIDDSVGVTVVDPLLYQFGNCCIMLFICIPFMLFSSERRSAMVEAVRSKKKYVVGIGIGGAGTYLVVLYAFRMADNAPFVVVLRQSSIVFGTMLGVAILKEPMTLPKLLGVLLITAGVAVIDCSDGG
jgi:uncharacterized membrane protein